MRLSDKEATVSSPVRTHRTQQERSEHTREALLDATVECLLDLGYSGASVNEICKRAGVSRGAQQHHFTTKADLMTSALQHLFGKLIAQIADSKERLPPGPEKIAHGIDLLWQAFSGDLSTAAMELWVAARTDPELRAALLPVDKSLGHATLEFFRRTPTDLRPEQLETMLLLTVNLTRGLALDAMIGGDADRRARLLDEWKRIAVETYSS